MATTKQKPRVDSHKSFKNSFIGDENDISKMEGKEVPISVSPPNIHTHTKQEQCISSYKWK